MGPSGLTGGYECLALLIVSQGLWIKIYWKVFNLMGCQKSILIIRKLPLLFWACLFFLALVSAGVDADPKSAPVYSNNSLVAIVDGKPIQLDDIKNARIHEMMVALHKLQESELRQKIVEGLYDRHPELKRTEAQRIEKKDLINFYETSPGIKDLGPYEQMEPEIREYLEESARQKYFDRVFQIAVEKGWVVNFLKPPNDFRLVAGVGSAMVWFTPNRDKPRRVFFLEYSDFQCPFCRRVQGTITQLRKKYSKQVQFGYRHFPLPFHNEAKKMAEAVECARDQGRFWEFQSHLYKNSESSFDKKQLMKTARKVGVKDLKSFQTCWEGGKYQKRVLQDIEDGARIGIQGTPTFIIGLYNPGDGTVSGEMFSGAVQEEKFIDVIEKFLTLAKN